MRLTDDGAVSASPWAQSGYTPSLALAHAWTPPIVMNLKTFQFGLLATLAWMVVGSCGRDDPGSGELEIRRFDVIEVGLPASGLLGPPSPASPATLSPESQLPRVRGRSLGCALADLVRERTGGDAAWGSAGSKETRSIEIRNGILIVRNTPVVLKRVEDLMDEMRASGDPLTHYFPSFQ